MKPFTRRKALVGMINTGFAVALPVSANAAGLPTLQSTPPGNPALRAAWHLKEYQKALKELDPSIAYFYEASFEDNIKRRQAVQITAWRKLGQFTGPWLLVSGYRAEKRQGFAFTPRCRNI